MRPGPPGTENISSLSGPPEIVPVWAGLGPKNENISSGYHFAPRASAIKGCIHDDQTSDLATPKLRFERENKIEQLGDGSLFDGTR